MKKLLFLINTLDVGGAEKVLIDAVNALPENKYDITLMTVIDKGIYRDKLNSNIKYNSIVRGTTTKLVLMLAYLVEFVLPPRLIHRLFIGNGFDYEIAFLEGVPTKLIGASPNKRSKKYAWVHIDLFNTTGQIKAFGGSDERQKKCYRKYDKIICVSESTKDAFIKRFGSFGDVEVKYNLIDDESIRQKAKEPVKRSDRLRIVSVGRLEKQKGFDRLLNIAARLRDEGLDFELLIVGDGGERAALEAYITDNQLSGTVRLTGFTDNPYKYMNSADFLVFPSRAEGMSTVVAEAVILGKPVIASDCSGMREMLGDSEYGIVTENNDEAICDAVREMIVSEKLREEYEIKAKERSGFFAIENRLNELEKLF